MLNEGVVKVKPVKEGTVNEGSVKDGSVKEGTLSDGTPPGSVMVPPPPEHDSPIGQQPSGTQTEPVGHPPVPLSQHWYPAGTHPPLPQSVPRQVSSLCRI